ncbi:MAG: YlmC/YmxH family sporulation protein [Thermoanaerobacterales bacterium]|nr:YlmC/YmxH family sporulation protein [Bacillota bacterium]MDI6906236.1 YlmC/YmxH family sporulation protein [Thermoanaerobacterales bacterium]
MRIRDLVGKEIVNIFDGARLGVVGESDLILDPETGQIHSIILPRRANLLNMWLDRQQLVLPWDCVRKIGSEVIVVDLDQTTARISRFAL